MVLETVAMETFASAATVRMSGVLATVLRVPFRTTAHPLQHLKVMLTHWPVIWLHATQIPTNFWCAHRFQRNYGQGITMETTSQHPLQTPSHLMRLQSLAQSRHSP